MKAFLAILGVCLLSSTVHGVVICYWGSCANGRTGIGRFGASDLDVAAHLCTHIVYSFCDLDAGTGELILSETSVADDDDDYDYDYNYDYDYEIVPKSIASVALSVSGHKSFGKIEDFIALKKDYPDVKLILAASIWSAGSENFSAVVNNETLRATYVKNVVTYLNESGLDGFDADYPGQRGGIESDREGFVYLLQELKAAFEPYGFYLSTPVAVTQANIDLSYLVPEISAAVDHVNLKTYDYHGSWDTTTGVNSPLYPQTTDAADSILNQNSSVHVWIKNGADASKLVLGLGNYGHSFTLASTSDVGTNAPVSGPGVAGNFTAEAGTLAYYEICLDQVNNPDDWSITEVEGNYVYANKGLQWVGYDNVNTIAAKASYAKAMGLGGIMFWAADLDDFSNQCGFGDYPLTRAAVKAWNAC